MQANRKAVRALLSEDSAVSPVIAVILMVAITVVLAATVYVWVSGFTAGDDPAPNATFKVVSCDEDNEQFVVKLISGGPLQLNDLSVKVFHVTAYDEGTQNGGDISLGTSGTWSTAGTQTITLNGGGTLEPDNSYEVSLIDKPSQQIIASPQFTC